MKKILVAHDGSKASDKALRKAIDIAIKFQSSLSVLGVVPELYLTELSDAERQRITDSLERETKAQMDAIRTKVAGKTNLEIKTIVRQGPVQDIIIETARKMKIDLLVVGSHGRHGARKFLLGSVSARVVDHSPCAVLVVK